MTFLAALLLLGVPAAGQSVPAGPVVGDIFDVSVGERFRGWSLQTDGIGDGGRSYAIFERNGRLLLVLTRPIVRNRSGGVEVQKITHVRPVVQSAGETVVDGYDCPFRTMRPIISLYNRRTRTARGVFATSDGFQERRWIVDDPEQCAYSGD